MTKSADAGSQSLNGLTSPRTLLAIATAPGILLAMYLPPWLPLQDLGEWGYEGYIGSQLRQHQLTGQFSFLPYPVPNPLIQAVPCVLDLVLAPAVSTRLAADIYAVLALAIAWELTRRISPTRPVPYFLVLPFCVYFNASLWSGYFNFQFGLLILSVWHMLDTQTKSRPLVGLAFSMLTFFTHAIAWSAIPLMMALNVLKDRKPLTRLPALVSVGLFAWYLRCEPPPQSFTPVEHSGLFKTLAYKLYTVAKFGPNHSFIFSDAPHVGVARFAHLAGSAVNMICALVLIWIVCWTLYDAWRRPGQFVQQAKAADTEQALFPLTFHTSFLVDKWNIAGPR